ncbi:methyltransferase domain-containing protein [Acanthopleuribacter pedis]|uniref:Methyltransferase domain-containing protein n=1 Tax=Acanthopleuribacter pedis TaxID=442870 RepID=A0A8J7QHL4_9BACT|nr:methyltransferase domain-containing protein [Acanthopleuribacter pedis]MBO1320666.1 methyltransferase domain-containing protein [Acanthopleuribacter pedis]
MAEAGSYAFDALPESEAELRRLQRQARELAPVEQKIFQLAGLREGDRALDIGCGPGLVSVLLANYVGAGGSVAGVDISETLLTQARAYAESQQAETVTFQHGSVYDLNLDGPAFDFVYARLFFQHLAKPADALAQIVSHLRPGGRLCIVDIDDGWLSLVPEPEVYARFHENSVAGQAAVGGDRFVGRKLGRYLQQAGLVDVAVTILPMSSAVFGMETFLDVAVSPKWKMTAETQREQAHRDYQTLRALIDDPHAWGFLGLFVATGVKAS